MATAVKRKTSGSSYGKGIKIAATGSPGTTIHTAVASTTVGTYDEVYLWAYNGDTVARLLTVEFGETDLPIVIPIPSKSGLIPILPGLILQNALEIAAFADVTNVIKVFVFVNAITD